MATVVITFFLLSLTQFCIYKMDAEFLDRRRSGELSRREKRWSMNSQRLEEIVAELMKPISDVRRSFDTDLSALLEEYLTEAGLHALEASEAEGGEAAGAAPNFAELALLLQHSASVYGRKVDFLYQHVLSVSDSLQNSAQELEQAGEGGEAGGGRARAARAGGAGGAGFAALELAAAAGAAREPGAARPPPTLPRHYTELEPRRLAPHHRPLTDYHGDPIGLLADFHVAWRLQEGMLVDELEGWDGGGARSLRPIPLMELQAAIAAAAPPALPPPTTPPSPATPPTTPPTTPPPPLAASTPLDLALLPKKERKRKSNVEIDKLAGDSVKMVISKKARRQLQRVQEFSVPGAWLQRVVQRRAQRLLHRRHRCDQVCIDFRGFESSKMDVGGFLGWSSSEAGAAAAAAAAAAATAVAAPTAATDAAADSDDDGFFEQSSNGDSDTSRSDDNMTATSINDAGAWAAWQAEVVGRAEAGAARPLDVREQAARVLAALPRPAPPAPAPPAPAPALLAHAEGAHHVAGLFLATLFLANAGNVEIIQGPPLTLNSFSVRFVTDDARRYCSAAAADAALLAPQPHPQPQPRPQPQLQPRPQPHPQPQLQPPPPR